MVRNVTSMAPLGLALAMVASGCALLGADPRPVTMAQLITGAYDPAAVESVDLESFGVSFDDAGTFCEAAGTVPLRWTVDALVPMQVWVDAFSELDDVPEAAAPAVEHLVDFTQRRLRWSLSGEGERPTWDTATTTAAEALIDAALTGCPDLPMIVGLPGQSDRPSGWADMSDVEVADHCESMRRRFEEGVVQYEIDDGRPPRHHMELDLPITYYGQSDYFGLLLDEGGRPHVVPVPGGACDLS